MYVGILTGPVRKKPLSQVIPWAASQGIRGLELDVSTGSHFDAGTVTDANIAGLQQLLKTHNMRISSLACYVMLTGTAEQTSQARPALENAIRLAKRLGVSIICTSAGFPVGNKSRNQTIAEDLPGAFRPILDLAGQNGVKIALENWYRTNIMNLDNWRAVFDKIPDKHLGLNFDPSHLDWQGIDVGAAVREFKDQIFHVHAKDVSVDPVKLARVGYLDEGWWRYVLPGYGRIRWGEFITQLRRVGYDDVLSIEHEDDAFPAEEGFSKAASYLNSLVIPGLGNLEAKNS